MSNNNNKTSDGNSGKNIARGKNTSGHNHSPQRILIPDTLVQSEIVEPMYVEESEYVPISIVDSRENDPVESSMYLSETYENVFANDEIEPTEDVVKLDQESIFQVESYHPKSPLSTEVKGSSSRPNSARKSFGKVISSPSQSAGRSFSMEEISPSNISHDASPKHDSPRDVAWLMRTLSSLDFANRDSRIEAVDELKSLIKHGTATFWERNFSQVKI